MPARSRAPALLLGFEPFGGESVNPAMSLLELFHGKRIAGTRVLTGLLPVTFVGALSALAELLERERPVLVLALGQAGGRARLSLERVALNLIDARIPDNAGAQPLDVAAIAGAPDAYFSSLPLKAMLREMQAGDVPAELSLSAGTFVCNAVFFALRHLAATRWPTLRAGFLHLPYLPEQAARHPGAPSLDLETMRAGVEIALRTALATPVDISAGGGTLC